MEKFMKAFCLTLVVSLSLSAQSVDPCTQSTRLNGGTLIELSSSRTQATGNISGTNYHYEVWVDVGGANTASLNYYGATQGGGAAYRAEWKSPNDYLGRVGYFWNNGGTYTQYKNIYCDFNYTRSGQNTAGTYSFIGIYGWSRNPLVEYYIVEDWFGNQFQSENNPISTGTTGGTVQGTYTVDGSVYQVIKNNRTNAPSIQGNNTNFVQYFSIRQTPRKCGTISVTEHFKQWENMGMPLGNMYEAKFLTEAGGGTGWLELSYLSFSQEDAPRGSGYSLTVNTTPAGGGNVTKNPNNTVYAPNTNVQLTAQPASGWMFDRWSGDATGTNATITVTMNNAKNITANFVPIPTDCTTNLIKDGNFPGNSLTSNWTLNQGQYYGNSAATSSVSGGKVTVNITTAGAETYQPQFIQKNINLEQGTKYRLTFTASAAAARSINVLFQQNGTPYTAYASGNFNLTATPQTFMHEFEMTSPSDLNTQLALNLGGTGATQSVTISDIKLVCIESFTFALTTSASPAAGGSVNSNPATPASGRYDAGSSVMLTPVANDGWEFEGWSGDATGSQSPLTVTMNADKNITANFVPIATESDCTANLVKDGNFPGNNLNSANWSLNQGQYYGNSAATSSVVSGKITINITTAGAETYQPQLIQKNIALEQGTKYRLIFTASAAAARSINVLLQQSSAPYASYASEDFNLTATPQAFPIEFEMTNPSDPNTQLAFNLGGTGATQNVTISDVKLTCIESESELTGISGEISAETSNESKLRINALSNSAVNVNFTATGNGETELRLYNLKGDLITSAKLQTVAGKNYSHTFNQEKLPGGLYVVRMHNNSSVEWAKVVIPK